MAIEVVITEIYYYCLVTYHLTFRGGLSIFFLSQKFFKNFESVSCPDRSCYSRNLLLLTPFLAHLAKGNVSICPHFASVVS
jgi:hypothetical protein